MLRKIPRRPARSSGSASMLLVLAVLASTVSSAIAQNAPDTKRLVGGFYNNDPLLPEKPPRPTQGPDGVDNFVDTISSLKPDGMIEIVLGRPRVLTLKQDIGRGNRDALIAVGDPSIIDYDLLGLRHIRVFGLRAGVTDLEVITSDNESYTFRIHVIYDLDVMRAQLKAMFPDALVRLAQIREHVIVEGQARDTKQVNQILTTMRLYLASMSANMQRDTETSEAGGAAGAGGAGQGDPDAPPDEGQPEGVGVPAPDVGGRPEISARFAEPQLINLLRVPTTQQVLLKVRVAELNRTAMRDAGFSFAKGLRTGDPEGKTVLDAGNQWMTNLFTGGDITGVLDAATFTFGINALRNNNLLKVLSEPNLTCMDGHRADVFAGGEFPILVPQASGGAGGAVTFTVQYREFGTRLGFVPFVMDHEQIRLTVAPEVTDRDDAQGVAIPGVADQVVPALVTRRAQTTVQLKTGQTLAMAGLLNMRYLASTNRIPGVGDIPYFGMFWSNNSTRLVETELLVFVTPYLVEPMNQDQVMPGPGDEVYEPNDLEFYLLQRIEGRTGRDYRSTTVWDDVYGATRIMNLEKRRVQGSFGFSN